MGEIRRVSDAERALAAQIDEQGGQLVMWRDRMIAAEAELAEYRTAADKLAGEAKVSRDELARLRAQEPVAWHNPVATAVRDSMTGQVQLEYIGHLPADELVRLYAAPQPHHIDLVNVAVAVRDACHRAWVTSAENWRSDIDVRQIVADTSPPPAQPDEPKAA